MSEWVRAGECNNCGWCCDNLGRFQLTMTTPDIEFIKVRGGPLIQGDFHAPCQYHIENRCAIYDTRPRTCSDFPSEPNEIIRIPCSYWFERSVIAEDGTITFEKQGGQGSPFPVPQ